MSIFRTIGTEATIGPVRSLPREASVTHARFPSLVLLVLPGKECRWGISDSIEKARDRLQLMAGLSEYDKEWCARIHGELVKWSMTSPFRVPVDPVRDNAPTYFDVVTKPMDLQTMKRKLTDGQYKAPAEFVDDFLLICDNAIKFNGESSMFAYMALDLKNWIKEQFKNKAASSEDEWHQKLTDVIDKLKEHVKSAPPAFTGMIPKEVA
jgi:hypothetical protein